MCIRDRPSPAKLRQALERGQMVLDVLLKADVPVAYNRSHIAPAMLTPVSPNSTKPIANSFQATFMMSSYS